MRDLAAMLKAYKKDKIAIYGLSIETEKVLDEIASEFHIIGLLDGYRTEGILYGKPIIRIEQAVNMQVKLILVVARPGSCKAIAKRIGKVCMEHKIHLLDVRGKNLCEIKKVSYDFGKVKGRTKQEILERILEKEIISFDLFDTLIMRQTMFSTDILELVDCKLREQGIIIQQFWEKRLSCEKELSNYTAPTLTEIYAYMKTAYAIPNLNPQKAAELEWQVDNQMIIPRKEVCELMFMASRLGKTIYIVSDSYYTKKQLIKILDKCEIKGYADIFVSCEFQTGKTQKLFQIFKERTGAQSYLHIGDDEFADVESAEKNQMEACSLYSGTELLELSGYMGMWNEIKTLSDRIRVGMFTAKLFNSPFLFEFPENRICVYHAYDLGYLFFAPIICDFIFWFREKVQENRIKNILFCARDGYLIKKLYDELAGDTSSIYFLTSRMAAIRAGIENIDDLRYVEEMKFSGSLQEQLNERFGISVAPEVAAQHKHLLDYTNLLLEKAARCKKGYQHYIDRLGIQEGETAFFDFVAKGTSQMYIGRLLNNHLKGYYFLQLDEAYRKEKGLDIESFYQIEEMDNSAIFEHYYLLEAVLTAPDPSVKEIDAAGRPVYAEETRTDKDISCFQEVQKGINDYVQTYLELCPKSLWNINKKLDEIMLSFIHEVSILDKEFLNLKVEDSFFNRTTAVTDLL